MNDDGQVLRSLFMSSDKWVHRRIQTIDDTVPGRTKITTSLDLTVPKNKTIQGSLGHVIIPIALLPKRVMLSWWVADSSGKPLTILNHTTSNKLVRVMLESSLKIAGVDVPTSSTDQDRILGFIENRDNNGVTTNKRTSKEVLELLKTSSMIGEKKKIGLVEDSIDILERSWIVLIEVPDSMAGRRCIIKYGYDLQITMEPVGIRRDNDSYNLPVEDPGFSRSLHFEVISAPELEIYDFSLRHLNAKQSRDRVLADVKNVRCVAHLQNEIYIPRFGGAELQFRLRPIAYGIRKFTDVALFSVIILVIIATIIRLTSADWFLLEDWRKHTTAAVILALPALLFSWLARTPETMGVARSYYRLRLINILLAVTMLLMAAALSTLWQPWVWNLIWLFVATCCIIAAWLRYNEAKHRRPTQYQYDDSGKGD